MAAFALFALTMAGGTMLALKTLGHATSQNHSSSKPDRDGAHDSAANDDAAFFYRAIGSAQPVDSASPVSAKRQINEQGELAAYTLEIKVATDLNQAEAVIGALKQVGIDAYYTPLARAGRVVYRVRQGIFNTPSDAKQAAIALQQMAKVDATVVKLQ
jgi:hypothetical protein